MYSNILKLYYIRKRFHSKLGYLSPKAFEAKMVSWQCVCGIREKSWMPNFDVRGV